MDKDRELLELAAKAAGYEVLHGFSESAFVVRKNEEDAYPHKWNPLTDDGDALRLAVKLKLRVTHFGDVVAAGPWTGDKDEEAWTGLCGADPYDATRRAIVRAAAEIGRQQ